MEKEYWLVMVVVECLFAKGLSVGNLLGMTMGEVVFVRHFVKEKKLWEAFVVVGIHLERMGVCIWWCCCVMFGIICRTTSLIV